MSGKPIPVVDLFAGPGGLGEGFSRVENGEAFRTIISIEKDLNWGGKRLGDAGLIRKVRTHWELTDEGKRNFFTEKTLTLLCELAGGRAKKKANKKGR